MTQKSVVPAPMSMTIVWRSASIPYATANGSDTMRSASAIPFTAARRCCRETRSASAGTPTTA